MNENSSKYYLVAIFISRDNTFQGLCPLVLLLQEAVTIVIVGPHFALIILLTQQPALLPARHVLEVREGVGGVQDVHVILRALQTKGVLGTRVWPCSVLLVLLSVMSSSTCFWLAS